MNRIAICFHGLSSSISDKGFKINFKDSFNSIKKYIINSNKNFKYDIYFHTWNNTEKKKIIKIIKPKKYIFENVIDFTNVIGNSSRFKKYLNKEYTGVVDEKKYIHSLYSRFYSLWKSIEIVENMEDYKYIISLRFDLILKNKINFNNLSNDCLICSKFIDFQDNPDIKFNQMVTLDGAKLLYDKDLFNYGVMDYIFISNSNIMKKISTIFMNISNYFSENSSYFINNKWPCLLSGHPLCAYHIKINNIKINYYLTCDKDFCLDRDKFNIYMDSFEKNSSNSKKLIEIIKEIEKKYTKKELPWNLISRIGTAYWRSNKKELACKNWTYSYNLKKNKTDCINLIIYYDEIKNKNELKKYCNDAMKYKDFLKLDEFNAIKNTLKSI
jgi:hypothetical protein